MAGATKQADDGNLNVANDFPVSWERFILAMYLVWGPVLFVSVRAVHTLSRRPRRGMHEKLGVLIAGLVLVLSVVRLVFFVDPRGFRNVYEWGVFECLLRVGFCLVLEIWALLFAPLFVGEWTTKMEPPAPRDVLLSKATIPGHCVFGVAMIFTLVEASLPGGDSGNPVSVDWLFALYSPAFLGVAAYKLRTGSLKPEKRPFWACALALLCLLAVITLSVWRGTDTMRPIEFFVYLVVRHSAEAFVTLLALWLVLWPRRVPKSELPTSRSVVGAIAVEMSSISMLQQQHQQQQRQQESHTQPQLHREEGEEEDGEEEEEEEEEVLPTEEEAKVIVLGAPERAEVVSGVISALSKGKGQDRERGLGGAIVVDTVVVGEDGAPPRAVELWSVDSSGPTARHRLRLGGAAECWLVVSAQQALAEGYDTHVRERLRFLTSACAQKAQVRVLVVDHHNCHGQALEKKIKRDLRDRGRLASTDAVRVVATARDGVAWLSTCAAQSQARVRPSKDALRCVRRLVPGACPEGKEKGKGGEQPGVSTGLWVSWQQINKRATAQGIKDHAVALGWLVGRGEVVAVDEGRPEGQLYCGAPLLERLLFPDHNHDRNHGNGSGGGGWRELQGVGAADAGPLQTLLGDTDLEVALEMVAVEMQPPGEAVGGGGAAAAAATTRQRVLVGTVARSPPSHPDERFPACHGVRVQLDSGHRLAPRTWHGLTTALRESCGCGAGAVQVYKGGATMPLGGKGRVWVDVVEEEDEEEGSPCARRRRQQCDELSSSSNESPRELPWGRGPSRVAAALSVGSSGSSVALDDGLDEGGGPGVALRLRVCAKGSALALERAVELTDAVVATVVRDGHGRHSVGVECPGCVAASRKHGRVQVLPVAGPSLGEHLLANKLTLYCDHCQRRFVLARKRMVVLGMNPATGAMHSQHITAQVEAVRALYLPTPDDESTLLNVSMQQLTSVLEAKAPARLHVCAHGGVAGTALLLVPDAAGSELEVVPFTTLVQAWGSLVPARGGSLELVFLNCCHSLALGSMLHKNGVEFVVCWKSLVADAASTAFAKAFYAHLAQFDVPSQAFWFAVDRVAKVVDHGIDKDGNEKRVEVFSLVCPGSVPTVKWGGVCRVLRTQPGDLVLLEKGVDVRRVVLQTVPNFGWCGTCEGRVVALGPVAAGTPQMFPQKERPVPSPAS